MAGSLRWQYHLVWQPGEAFSTVQVVAAGSDGRRHVWDVFESDPYPTMPNAQDVLDVLHSVLLHAMERQTHHA